MRRKRRFGHFALAVLTGFLAVSFLMPTVLTVAGSFMEQSQISASYGQIFDNVTGGEHKEYLTETGKLKFLPDRFCINQYITVLFRSPDYLRKLRNSVILAVPIVVLQPAVAAATAYGFTRWRGKVRGFLFFLYTVLMLMPAQVTLVPNWLVSHWLGLLGTGWAVIFPGIFAPFSVFLLTKAMRRIPGSVIEAAGLDGAGEWRVFKDICLPQCRSALYAVTILSFFDAWSMVEQPVVLLPDPAKQPLSVTMSVINSSQLEVAFAAAVIYMAPCLLLFLHGKAHLAEGIPAQGVMKGS